MTTHSIDIAYAWVQLGLNPGVSREDVDKVLANAAIYKFSMRGRIDHVRRFVEFFAARAQLGMPEDSFDAIRKSYHKQAMQMHPDRNRGNRLAEERLKSINAAYAVVVGVHREARDYFELSESARRAIEKEARETTERERPQEAKRTQDEAARSKEFHDATRHTRRAETHAQQGIRYMAASVPRFIRTARLGYLRLDCVIGSWFIEAENDMNYVFDVIMLPEREFIRARNYLGVPDGALPSLDRGRFSPTYIPKDTKSIIMPPSEAHPAAYARKYFLKEFKLEKE